MSDNHCPYCQASISGPFHTGQGAVYQAEIGELEQENAELRIQIERLNRALTGAINAIRNPFTLDVPPDLYADHLAVYLVNQSQD